MSPVDWRRKLEELVQISGEIILGKTHQLRLAISCLAASGHLLLEDGPGVGKTTLAHTLAMIMGLNYQRIQFTSDLLPADILGVSIYEQDSGRFHFHPGPIFTQLLLADEINRATPRTQSALLEAMAESQITIEGQTRHLPNPFFVIATQNPSTQLGTFQLPESQLDRFLLSLSLGYPDSKAERVLLGGRPRRDLMRELSARISPEDLGALQSAVSHVHVSEALYEYIQALLNFSRDCNRFIQGLSPRAGLALLHCARAWALLHGQEYVRPEDVQAVLPGVVRHRLKMINSEERAPGDPAAILLQQVAIP